MKFRTLILSIALGFPSATVLAGSVTTNGAVNTPASTVSVTPTSAVVDAVVASVPTTPTAEQDVQALAAEVKQTSSSPTASKSQKIVAVEKLFSAITDSITPGTFTPGQEAKVNILRARLRNRR
jgi:hypothetical protein